MKKRAINILSLVIITICLINFIHAEKLGIDVKNSYSPSEEMNFKITLYDDNNNIIPGEVSYTIKNYYYETMNEGISQSGENVKFKIPDNALQGLWEISAKYNDITTNSVFSVGELKKIDIKLEGNELVIKNIGNVIFDNDILITIGENKEVVRIILDVGQTKVFKITAPPGEYTVTVNDASSDEEMVFNSVSLTGNVIGIESIVGTNFWNRYPIVGMFLISVFVVAFIVASLRFRLMLQKKNNSRKK